MYVDLLVIGAQAAGLSAVSRAKRKKKNLEVLVLEKDPYVSVDACGLPYYIGGMVPTKEDLMVLDVRTIRETRGIPVLTGHEVKAIDPARREVTAYALDEQKEMVFRYDKLVIATGARVKRPGAVGEDLPEVFTLKTLEDGMKIRSFIENRKPKRAAIIGAGVIGLEMAEAFRRQGLEVIILKRPGSILKMLDDEMIQPVTDELNRQGVELCLDLDIQRINARDGRVVSITCSGEDYPADMVLLATGTGPQADLAKAAGLAIGPFGDIVVDERMFTSDPNILAAGDCVAQLHRVSGQMVYLPRGTTANKQGRIAGENAFGGDERFPGVLGTAAVKIFDLVAATTGLNEKAAQAAGFNVGTAQISHPSHAISYPDPYPEPIHVRMVVEKGSGRLLGTQMVGKTGVAKRIDILAAAITAEMTAAQVGELDLSYSPPFSPAWDPVLVAANAAAKVV